LCPAHIGVTCPAHIGVTCPAHMGVTFAPTGRGFWKVEGGIVQTKKRNARDGLSSSRGFITFVWHRGRMENISWLRVPEPAELPEDVQTLFLKANTNLGFVPNVMRAWALRPAHLMAWWAHYELIMRGESKLSRAQREMIAVAISSVNRCYYCSTTHPAFLRLELAKEARDVNLAHEIAFAPLHADLSDQDKAMLEFALKVTTESHNIGPEDHAKLRAVGLDDETIFDVAEIAAMFNFTNRLANATGIRPNPEYNDMGREK
jgi:uncharacterized peroxidase-related enzyme